ncbi:recombinase family protein (plasmid) [Candidatus Megaera polyxenophila]|uniref:recombinase family protein n=1 Tax=Candidatus Megaera polyxenophila TaxID=988779 RepID=UPI00249F39F0|nr:recombinase family protein [Candidatus Megaera polyxenophila]
MTKIIAYIRTSTDKQELNNQKLAILEYAQKNNLKINEFVEIQMSSKKTPKQRRIEEVLEKLSSTDMLIVTELSRFGRSTPEVIELVNELVARSIRVVILKQNLDISKHDMNSKVTITLFALFSDLERDLISQRTKDALALKKSQGQVLGKPVGTVQKSKFDKDANKIIELLALGLSIRKIAKFLGYKNHISLNTYVNKRNLKDEV